jgi:hypothetical protein
MAEMGFSRDAAAAALQQTSGNVSDAVSLLSV